MARIDPVTADTVRRIIMISRARGVDPVIPLDRAGLLQYPGARREYAAILLEEVIRELSSGPTGRMMNSLAMRTPLDMKVKIIEALEGFVRQWRNEATPPAT